MKKFFVFLFVTAMVCKSIKSSLTSPGFDRCENDEVICYVRSSPYKGGMSCKWK